MAAVLTASIRPANTFLLQADVIIDETYAENPTTYDSAALLKDWGLTEAEAASLPAWANKKVGRCAACHAVLLWG